MGRDTVQLETTVNTISHEYLLKFTSEYGILETLHPELPGPEDRIVDFPEGKVGVYTRRANAPKDGMPTDGTYSVEAVRALDTHCTPIQKQPEMLLNGPIQFDSCPKSYEVEDWEPPTRPHDVPLLTLTATRVIEMDEPTVATDSSGVPSTIERSPLDFDHEAEASDRGTAAPEMSSPKDVPATAAPGAGQAEETAVTEPPVARESRKRGHDGIDANAPKVIAKGSCRPSTLRKVLVVPGMPKINLSRNVNALRPHLEFHRTLTNGIRLCFNRLTSRSTIPLAPPRNEACHQSEVHPTERLMVATLQERVSGEEKLKAAFEEFKQYEDSRVKQRCAEMDARLDAPSIDFDEELYPYMLTAIASRQVAMGSQLRRRFEQEAKLLRKSVAQVACRDKRIQARELEIKNMEALLEAKADMKKAAEGKSHVATLQKQVSGEEKLKAAFEEFKRYEDDRVERWCTELDSRLDALSIDFDEELYPHMLTAIVGRKWVIGHGLRLAMMKCAESLEMRQAFADVVSARVAKGMSEGLKHGVEHGEAQLKVESIEAYDLKAEAKFVAALQSLKDLNRGDAPQYIRDLRPSSSQLTIPVYPELRDPQNPWAYKEEMKLSDAIAANTSRAEKKKKCRIVCRTYRVGSAHHARSDGVPVSVPTVVPQGLALLLVDAATQTDLVDT
uniref:Transposase (Putative), gypsy type n=1 Tax=Tanacetum cinerariifolium TaxID=118510 RepID=A0A6L2LNB9_TANCI|nr:hypothetical protein [Tanacetum cinerariifolium]